MSFRARETSARNPGISRRKISRLVRCSASPRKRRSNNSIGIIFARHLAKPRRTEIKRARALVFVLPFGQLRAAMPAEPRQDRLRASDSSFLLIAREVDDFRRWRYKFL